MTYYTGDNSPDLTGSVNANLAGVSGVELHIRKPDGVVLTKAATVTDAATGAWSITWGGSDLSVAGIWTVEAQVTFSGAKVQTFGPERFVVQSALG